MDGSIECHDGLATRQSQRLQLVVDEIEQLVVVACVDLDEQIVASRGVVTLHYLRDFLQFFYHDVERTGIFQEETHIGARLIPNLLGVDDEL